MHKPASPPFALISVSDKSQLIYLAENIHRQGFRILATDGTAALLAAHQIPATSLSAYTGHPEILGGRVKTLHPKIHGGILLDPSQPDHLAEAAAHGIEPIAMVVVNLYPFAEKAVNARLPLEEAIEWIDIGGPTLLRAAAKNWRYCLPLMDPSDYEEVVNQLTEEQGVQIQLRLKLAAKVFERICAYDQLIYRTFLTTSPLLLSPTEKSAESLLADDLCLSLTKVGPLRYGENPQQEAALYRPRAEAPKGFANLNVLQGKEVSYNNLLDLDSAARLVQGFVPDKAIAIIKHTNPCGVATGRLPLADLFSKALASDPKSAFGGIVASNHRIDAATAQLINEIYCECIIAPGYDDEALGVLAHKKNVRVVAAGWLADLPPRTQLSWRPIYGAMLAQTEDAGGLTPKHWRVVTKHCMEAPHLEELCFAMEVARHVKSNAIVLSQHLQTIGIGAGQMSRIDALELAIRKAQQAGHSLVGATLASDAFFPFKDCVELAAHHGITHIVQPGGSLRDHESIAAADAAGVCMVFTNLRFFKH